MDGFAESLALADEILLLDIYPARELPMAGITSDILFEKINHSNKKLCSKKEAISFLGAKDTGVIATLGAGDIDQIIIPIKQQLETINV